MRTSWHAPRTLINQTETGLKYFSTGLARLARCPPHARVERKGWFSRRICTSNSQGIQIKFYKRICQRKITEKWRSPNETLTSAAKTTIFWLLYKKRKQSPTSESLGCFRNQKSLREGAVERYEGCVRASEKARFPGARSEFFFWGGTVFLV